MQRIHQGLKDLRSATGSEYSVALAQLRSSSSHQMKGLWGGTTTRFSWRAAVVEGIWNEDPMEIWWGCNGIIYIYIIIYYIYYYNKHWRFLDLWANEEFFFQAMEKMKSFNVIEAFNVRDGQLLQPPIPTPAPKLPNSISRSFPCTHWLYIPWYPHYTPIKKVGCLCLQHKNSNPSCSLPFHANVFKKTGPHADHLRWWIPHLLDS